jgi:hypothetical protein
LASKNGHVPIELDPKQGYEYQSKPTRCYAVQINIDNLDEVRNFCKAFGGALTIDDKFNPPEFQAMFPVEDGQEGEFSYAAWVPNPSDWLIFDKVRGILSTITDPQFRYFYERVKVHTP